jgi:hypothetical protein
VECGDGDGRCRAAMGLEVSCGVGLAPHGCLHVVVGAASEWLVPPLVSPALPGLSPWPVPPAPRKSPASIAAHHLKSPQSWSFWRRLPLGWTLFCMHAAAIRRSKPMAVMRCQDALGTRCPHAHHHGGGNGQAQPRRETSNLARTTTVPRGGQSSEQCVPVHLCFSGR